MDEIFDKIKEQAIKLKGEATKVTKHMVGKTNDVISKTKLSIAISEAESKIKDLHIAMGKKVYDEYANKGETDEKYLEGCEKIDLLVAEINELKDKLSQMKDTKLCDCGEYSKKDSMYCAKCGKKFEGEENAEYADEDMVIITPKESDTQY